MNRSKSRYVELIRVESLAKVAGSTFFARTAQRMYSILIVLFVLETGHSAAIAGLIVLVIQIPGLFISPLAGVLLDRSGRIKMMWIDYSVACTSIALIMTLSLLHHLSIDLLFLIALLSAFTQPLSAVGARSLYPLIVPRELWDHVNAVDNAGFVVGTIVGPAVGGVAVALLGPSWALSLPVALYLLAALTLIGVRVPAPSHPAHGALFSEAWSGVRFVFSHPTLRMLSGTSATFYAATGVATVTIPTLVLQHYHAGSTTVGVMFAVSGVVGFITGIAVGARGTDGRERTCLGLAMGFAAIGLLTLGLSSHIEALAFVGTSIVGASQGLFAIPMFSLRQRMTDPANFGRVLSVTQNLSMAGSPFTNALAGEVIDHSVLGTFLIFAGIAAVGTIWPIAMKSDHKEPSGNVIATPRPAQ